MKEFLSARRVINFLCAWIIYHNVNFWASPNNIGKLTIIEVDFVHIVQVLCEAHSLLCVLGFYNTCSQNLGYFCSETE